MEDRFSILSSGICKYTYYGKRVDSVQVSKKSIKNLTHLPLFHSLSVSSSKKIKAIISHWYIAIKLTQKKQHNVKSNFDNYLVMITLTLPSKQVDSDKVLKSKILNTFLTKLRYHNQNFNYLWVSERQKNGNIHFHLIVDKWFDKMEVQRLWNDSLANLSYIDSFQKKFGHRNPPSTKITGQQQMKDAAEYLSKYASKGTDNQAVEGKVWDCSDCLLKIVNLSFSWKWYYYNLIDCDFYKLKMKYIANDFREMFLFSKNFVTHFLESEIFKEIESELLLRLSELFEVLRPVDLLKKNNDINMNYTQLQFAF